MRALFAVGVSLLAVVAGCGGATEESAPPPESSNRPAPQVEGISLDGSRISLEDFRGRPLFVNVWSSW